MDYERQGQDMKLSECKQRMKLYRDDATTVYNWRTTARWALRYQWACEENERLQLELQFEQEQLREHGQAYNTMEASARECKAAQEATYLRAAIAEEALAERNKPCIWQHGYGDAWRGFIFCPVCGHPVKREP